MPNSNLLKFDVNSAFEPDAFVLPHGVSKGRTLNLIQPDKKWFNVFLCSFVHTQNRCKFDYNLEMDAKTETSKTNSINSRNIIPTIDPTDGHVGICAVVADIPDTSRKIPDTITNIKLNRNPKRALIFKVEFGLSAGDTVVFSVCNIELHTSNPNCVTRHVLILFKPS